MLNNTYYRVYSGMISRWKWRIASKLGKDQMDHTTGPILVWFWYFMVLHCIAPSRSKVHKGRVDHTGMWLHHAAGCWLSYPPSWYPCACCNHRCQTRGHQLGIILQSLNLVRDGKRGICQAGWKFCLNNCKFTKCSWGNILMKTEYATVGKVVYSCH